MAGPLHMGAVGAGVSALGLMGASFFGLRNSIAKAVASSHEALVQANTDALTGALTRAFFLHALADMFAGKNEPVFGYIHLDMDNLKVINDGSGHAAGDAAIRHLMSRVRAVLPDALIGRLGGDEFGIALPGIGDKDVIIEKCERIRAALHEPVVIEGRYTRVTATMGIAVAPEDAGTVDEIVTRADLALYQGKSQGRDMVVPFEREMMVDKRHRRFIERELRAAILMNELTVYYQPIYDACYNRLLYHEALVRWEHPVRGIVSPGAFIPIAEKSDLIDKLGDWVLRRVCEEMDRLDAPMVSVNVSVAQLRRSNFASRFAEILQETGIAGERLIVEVTETVPLATDGVEKTNLDALKALNVQMAIDDFGAGNASVSYLKRTSFDVLKIDRSYVTGIADNKLDYMMVEAMCRIAKAADMQVVAEGVETSAQLVALRRLGCIGVQGFLLGHPQPLKRIIAERDGTERAITAA